MVQRWTPKPDLVLEWGIRASDSELEWLNWIAENAPTKGPLYPRQASRESTTIKDALLEGYDVEIPESAIGRAWLTRWTSQIAQYRGSVPIQKKQGNATHVRISQASKERVITLLQAEMARRHCLQPANNGPESLKNYSDIWWVQCVRGAPTIIDIEYCAPEGGTTIPAFDLFREGCCQGAAWGYRNGTWELILVWL